MVLLGDGDVQPKSMEVVKKTPVTMNETKKVIDKMLTVPNVPKKKTSSCHVSGIPRCISSKKFQDIMKKKEQEKKELKEAKECKRKCLENAEEKKDIKKWQRRNKEKSKIEKAKAAAMAALAALRPKRERRAPKKFEEMSSSDSDSNSDAIIYEDSSESKIDETADTFEGSTSFCAKCLTVFKGKEKETAIGCDTPYCR